MNSGITNLTLRESKGESGQPELSLAQPATNDFEHTKDTTIKVKNDLRVTVTMSDDAHSLAACL